MAKITNTPEVIEKTIHEMQRASAEIDAVKSRVRDQFQELLESWEGMEIGELAEQLETWTEGISTFSTSLDAMAQHLMNIQDIFAKAEN